MTKKPEIKKKKDFYNDMLEEHGGKSVKSLGWDDESKAIQRYSLVAHELSELGVKSVLDYGCGLCHLRPYIPMHVQYHGYDINEKCVESVRANSPDTYITDWLGEWPFEAVVAVGTFSYREIDESENEFMEEVINNIKLIKDKIKPKYIVMSVLWKDACDYFDPKLFYFKDMHLNQIEKSTGAKFVKLKSILYHENILIFKW